jgi:hypothetical protein
LEQRVGFRGLEFAEGLSEEALSWYFWIL